MVAACVERVLSGVVFGGEGGGTRWGGAGACRRAVRCEAARGEQGERRWECVGKGRTEGRAGKGRAEANREASRGEQRGERKKEGRAGGWCGVGR